METPDNKTKEGGWSQIMSRETILDNGGPTFQKMEDILLDLDGWDREFAQDNLDWVGAEVCANAATLIKLAANMLKNLHNLPEVTGEESADERCEQYTQTVGQLAKDVESACLASITYLETRDEE